MSALSQFVGPDKNPLQLGIVTTVNCDIKIGVTADETSSEATFFTKINLSGASVSVGSINGQYYTVVDINGPGYLTHILTPYLSVLGNTSIKCTIDGSEFIISKTHAGRLLLGAFDYALLKSDYTSYNSSHNNLSSTSGKLANGFASGGTNILTQGSTVIIPPPIVLSRKMANIKFNTLKVEVSHSVALETYGGNPYAGVCFVI